ncbi:MAG TPA: DUF5915 domain-containing protein, partial [Solirubrobacteraceae bacterium]|nr:DUF5915 domain-containing protein [Solirubrobacteraceae bacterium]
PWDGYRFSLEAVGESVRQFLLQLWNTYGFYVLYANASSGNGADTGSVAGAGAAVPSDLDHWVLSRLGATVEAVRDALDEFDATTGGRAIAAFVDELSNWYVRRSRRRFWEGDPSAFATLRQCLVTVSQLLAPFCPFIADEIYDNLDGSAESVHLCDFPEPGERDDGLEFDMGVGRETVRLGLAARAQAKLKIRQPLRAAVVVATGRERAAIERLGELVREELNVRELRFVSEADELGRVEIKPNYRSLGPRFGRQMPTVAAAVAALDPAKVSAALREARSVAITVGGQDHELDAEDLLVAMMPLEGYEVEREGSHAVALEVTIDDDLQAEGWVREIVHAVQAARRGAGLEVSDRIVLTLDGDPELLAPARAYQPHLAGETLAVEVRYAALEDVEPVTVDGRELRVGVERRA